MTRHKKTKLWHQQTIPDVIFWMFCNKEPAVWLSGIYELAAKVSHSKYLKAPKTHLKIDRTQKKYKYFFCVFFVCFSLEPLKS